MSMEAKTKDVLAEKPDPRSKARELAEAGSYNEALTCLRSYLDDQPDDAETINDIGAILFSQGKTDQAIEYFIKAKNLCDGRAEILWNLSEAYLACGQAQKAVELFGNMEQIGILNPDVLNRTANVFLHHEKLDEAIEMLERSLQMAPAQDILKPMLEVIRSKKTSDRC